MPLTEGFVSRSDIPAFTFREYRKTGLTRISDEVLKPGTTVDTFEGELTCQRPSRLAIDAKGYVYPIEESVFRESYLPMRVEGERLPERELSPGEIEWLAELQAENIRVDMQDRTLHFPDNRPITFELLWEVATQTRAVSWLDDRARAAEK